MKVVKIIMPSQGDMTDVRQEEGTITFTPTYFGGEAIGPTIQFVDEGVPTGDGKAKDVVQAAYRIKFKAGGEIKVVKAGL
jgi:hypothetical protein